MFKDPNLINLTFLLVIILVPIVPAFVFFKWLPAEGNVAGTWHGMRIKLTGAFAGYFAIFLILIYLLQPKITPLSRVPPVWTVVGEIARDPQISPESQIHFNSSAETFTGKAYADYRFEIRFRKSDDEDFPDVFLVTDPPKDFPTIPIHLSKQWTHLMQGVVDRDDANRILTLKSPIKITKTGELPYAPIGPSPVPLANGPQVKSKP